MAGPKSNLRYDRAHQQAAVKASQETQREEKAIRKIAKALLARPLYQKQLKQALDEGTIHPTIHALLYHYAHGRPKEMIEVAPPVPVSIRHVYEESK